MRRGKKDRKFEVVARTRQIQVLPVFKRTKVCEDRNWSAASNYEKMYPRPGLQGSPAPQSMNSQWSGRMGIPTPGTASRGPAGGTPESSKRSLEQKSSSRSKSASKKKKVKDKVITQQVVELVPESQAYMDLLAFENKLDATIMRKRLDIQEALKRPIKQKRKLRVYISTNLYSPKPDEVDENSAVPQWEIRVEGKLLEDPAGPKDIAPKQKRKFSSFFKNLVIELDRDLYGPDNHLVEWHRTATTQETDGFQVKRPIVGDKEVKCTIFLLLDYQPPQFKLEERLGRVLGIHTQTRPVIVNALWQYVKNNSLQDSNEREYINNDKYLKQIFECERMKFCEIPQRLQKLLHPPDPIIIQHNIKIVGQDGKKATCYNIDVEIDDSLREMMQSFLLSTASQQEISALDSKIHETVEGINQLKVQRDFFLSFANDPQKFINDWLHSQSKDLKTMTDVAGNPEEERKSEFFNQPWTQEAVHRYFYKQVQQKRAELEQALGIRSST